MSGSGAGYDYSTTTYSPQGKIYQIDYAEKALENSGTCIGIRCSDGIVFAVEKKLLNLKCWKRLLIEGFLLFLKKLEWLLRGYYLIVDKLRIVR